MPATILAIIVVYIKTFEIIQILKNCLCYYEMLLIDACSPFIMYRNNFLNSYSLYIAEKGSFYLSNGEEVLHNKYKMAILRRVISLPREWYLCWPHVVVAPGQQNCIGIHSNTRSSFVLF